MAIERKERAIMPILQSSLLIYAAQPIGGTWLLLGGWLIGAIGILVGVLGALIGLAIWMKDKRTDRLYSETLGQTMQHWKTLYTEEQVRALTAEQQRLMDQIRQTVPGQARYVFLRDRQAALSQSLSALYQEYQEVTQQLADGDSGSAAPDPAVLQAPDPAVLQAPDPALLQAPDPALLQAIERDIQPAYLERQRREFWRALAVTVLLLVAAVPLALPLLYPFASLAGIAAPGGKSEVVAQFYDFFIVGGMSYLILCVAPARTGTGTPGDGARSGALFRFALPYVLLPLLWLAATFQFFMPYLMSFMGGVPVDLSGSFGGTLGHAGLGIASAVLSAILLRLLPLLRHRSETSSL
jgi:hypothetical protein